MKVIGFAGTNGSGKDTIADFIVQKFKYHKITVSDIIKQRMGEEGITEITRESQGAYQKKFVQQFGIDYWMREVVKEIKAKKWRKVAVSGLRYPTDVTTLRNEFKEKFTAILVDADPKIRFERMVSRGRADAPKSFEEFMKQENNENKMFNFDETFKLMDHRLDNGGTMEQSQANALELIRKIGFA